MKSITNDLWTTRRKFITTISSLAAAQVIGLSKISRAATSESGRLVLPGGKPTNSQGGLIELPGNSGFLYVPKNRTGKTIPLLILLHKAAGKSIVWFPERSSAVPGPYAQFAEKGGFAILAPDAPGQTWGVGPKSFGGEYQRINQTLAMAAQYFQIGKLAIGGFSDGASYALSLGLANGDFVSAIIAFSPGFIVRSVGRGRPVIFISHGLADRVLPIDVTSRSFVQQLRKNGYDVTFQEVGGGHEIPNAIRDQAMQWLIAKLR